MISSGWEARTERVESWLRTWLFSQASDIGALGHCRDVVEYTLLAPCKRFRPVLYLTVLEALGQPLIHGRQGALALECLHTYSLIHDDLPCMDDDDLRRGQPSSHRRYGEANAVLAGDALLTLSFECLGHEVAPVAGSMVLELACSAGMNGMVAGQVLDMNMTGAENMSLEDLQEIHRCKTGALISASFALAGIRAHQSEEIIKTLRELGHLVGLVFQIGDDILDVTATEDDLGKSVGKDVEQGKCTYPALLGLAGAREQLDIAMKQAKLLLSQLKLEDTDLTQVLDFLATRNH
jgi:geranylgeranyl diphosphate synthase type II